jgi:hypothetical protein
MRITRAAVVREVLYLVALLAVFIVFRTFLGYLVTNRVDLGIIVVYVAIRFAIFAAKVLRPAD